MPVTAASPNSSEVRRGAPDGDPTRGVVSGEACTIRPPSRDGLPQSPAASGCRLLVFFGPAVTIQPAAKTVQRRTHGGEIRMGRVVKDGYRQRAPPHPPFYLPYA